MNRTLDKLIAILRRDLLTSIRHRTGFVLALAALVIELAAFFYLSHAIGPGFRPDGLDYFPFLLVGTGLYTFFVMSTRAFLSSVEEAQQTGTMEVLMTTSTSPTQLIVLSSISAFAGSLANLFIYILAGVAIFRATIHPNLLACLLVLALSLALATVLGIAAATFQISVQKGSALIWLLGSLLWFLSGTMFPVQSLPAPLAVLGRAIPFTSAIDGLRAALLEGRTVGSLVSTLAPLALFVLIALPLSLAGLSLSLRRARHSGTLSFY
jgi:ABC-2 type transport system permease protein